MCEELMGLKLLRYEKRILPEYTSTVSVVFFNHLIDIEVISQIMKKRNS